MFSQFKQDLFILGVFRDLFPEIFMFDFFALGIFPTIFLIPGKSLESSSQICRVRMNHDLGGLTPGYGIQKHFQIAPEAIPNTVFEFFFCV